MNTSDLDVCRLISEKVGGGRFLSISIKYNEYKTFGQIF